MADSASHMAGKAFLGKIVCSQAYHCLQMADDESVQLLAFNFASRTFACKRLAQGLNRSVSAFSSFMREYLDPLIEADRCAQYMDDIGIAGRSAPEFIENLEAVFQKIREAGLKLSMRKSQFGVQEIDFLGRTIIPKGISPINAKVERFLDGLRLPTIVKQTQRFIGFINFYKDFIPKLPDKLLPFYKLLKNDTAFLITSDNEEAFFSLIEDLKRACNTSLRLPLPDKQFVIITDASEHAAGYALMFGSKTFNPAQMKHSAYVKEISRVYFAFSTFRHIVWGNKHLILILTDNKSLTRFFQTKHLPPSLWNHIDFILQFNFIIGHIPGRSNKACPELLLTRAIKSSLR